MSLLANSNAIESGGYNIDRSLRFRSSASAYLNRTPASAGNRTSWTYSLWAKIGAVDTGIKVLFQADTSSVDCIQLNNNAIECVIGGVTKFTTTAVFRDPSAWYHFVWYYNGSNIYLYANNVLVGSSALTGNTKINNNIAHYISATGSSRYFDGYLAEVNFIDGQALTPSSFGQTDAVTGVWTPKKYTGTYGTNGFYLPFSDNTSATTLAYDKSGNGNNWTPNNISTTSGDTYDSMTDVPTLTSATAANYCVINAVSNGYGTTAALVPTSGNLNFSDSTTTNKTCVGSMTAPSGKWYFELTCTSTGVYSVGLLDKQTNNESFYRNNGAYSASFGGGGTTGYSSWTNGDVIGVAWDADAGKLWFAKNNTWQSGSPSAGTSPTNTFTAGLSLFADIFTDNSAGTKSGSFNFGQRPFSYTPPTGFKALNTFNLD